ncbi:MAG: YggT family protein [Candidatus Dadabacteria bacterium]|nr:YggT family protein [Candidatus Dadabacteria bacterium]MCY4042958.1 YggT family protein [Candidatus Dadabacteria bacterium]MCY4047905.1 YggT family protein [Candidatus Dadabacteria bacterium]
MMIAQNTVMALAEVVGLILQIYLWLIVGRAIISWVDPNPYNPIVRFVYSATEPVLEQARRIIPPLGGIDLSPIAVLLLIIFLRNLIVNSLYDFASRL